MLDSELSVRIDTNSVRRSLSRLVVSAQSVELWESGKVRPTRSVLIRIAAHYGVAVDYLDELGLLADVVTESA